MSDLKTAQSEPLFNTNKKMVYTILGFLGFLIVLPVLGPTQFFLHLMIMIFMHAVISQSWNIIGGFSGQISLGHGAFLGLAHMPLLSFTLNMVSHLGLEFLLELLLVP